MPNYFNTLDVPGDVDLRNALVTGEETLARDLANSATAVTMTSQTLRLSYFTARKTEVTTSVRQTSGATAAAATPTLCRIGLYLIDAAEGGTLVAAIDNDTALFANASTAYTRSWATPYTKIAGQRYALGTLVVSGAAVPTITGASLPSSPAELAIAPRLSSLINSQADLPLSFVVGGLTTSSLRGYGVILP
jgi:hypothetical protein